ncbi:MAG: helix-turn-helix domain-containing protein [Halanaeroarchaeum sp.]
MIGSASRAGSESDDSGPLDVHLSITPPDSCGCPLLNHTIPSVQQSASGSAAPGNNCRLVVGSGENTSFTTAKIGEQCVCPVFDDHDCVWEILEVREDAIRFAATLPERSQLASLITELENAGATVTTDRILTSPADLENDEMLTDKQREAFIAAIESGYYDSPRQATLDDIAAELGVSKSAVSQRLVAARNRLARKFAEETGSQILASGEE